VLIAVGKRPRRCTHLAGARALATSLRVFPSLPFFRKLILQKHASLPGTGARGGGNKEAKAGGGEAGASCKNPRLGS
jgi:hypothetical protein